MLYVFWFPRTDLFGIENSTTSQLKCEVGLWNDFKFITNKCGNTLRHSLKLYNNVIKHF